ncbi:hypothetical protein [Luteolibacter marinus]|uniref:hypothetical protein n=1 Tax=Luteolibacter marinus TaxID=2776705 RepID=UPI0018689D39|nr:hypothetical protein [Luteolibacter marinus]
MNPTPPKPFYQSKTVWLNALVLVSTFIPPVAEWLEKNPVSALEVLGALNLLVRFATTGRVTLFDDDSSGGAGVSAGEGSGRDTAAAHDDSVAQRTSASPWLVAACAALLALPACSNLMLTGDGCIQTTQERDGVTYRVKTCLDAEGKIDRVQLFWTNETGRPLRGTIYRDDRPILVEFRDLDSGFWYRWTEGMGISLGAIPTEVAVALEPEPALPVEPAK